MRAFFAVLAAWLLSATLASAQMMGISGGPFTVGSTYVGPGDVVSGASAWWGLRAYKTSYATGSNKSVNLRRVSDSTTCDFNIASSGGFGTSNAGCSLGGGLSLAAFATQDATATCTIATTTATCTGASSTPHVGSTIVGTGLTQPCFASAVGSFTAGAGTVTLSGSGAASPCGTVSVAETLTFTYATYVTEAYDQTGNGFHVLQATTADQLQLFPNCGNSLPCMSIVAGSASMVTSGNLTPATGVQSYSVVSGGRSNGSQGVRILGEAAAQNRFSTVASANQWQLLGGSSGTITVTASDTGVHAGNAVINGASSVVNIDGTETTGATVGSTTAEPLGVMVGPTGTSIIMYFMEGGLWDNVAFTSTQRTNLCHNQFVYWSTAASC